MAGRLTSHENLKKQFATLAVGEVASAREALASLDQDRETAIHDTRINLKRLRSLLRLARPSLGEQWKAENVRWRDVGRGIAEARDAAALVEAFDDLASQIEDPEERSSYMAIRSTLVARRDAQASETGTAGAITSTKRALASAGRRLKALNWPADAEALETGLRRSYAEMRDAWKQARRDPDAETLHDWRKRVKDHAVHVGIMREANPDALKQRRRQAKELAELLGKDHDLSVLRDTIEASPREFGKAKVRGAFLKALVTRQESLRAEAFKIGGKLCRERPREYARALVKAWTETGQRQPLAEAAE